MAVFAAEVFESIVELPRPYMLGKETFDITERVNELCR